MHHEGDRVTGIELKDGSMVTARYYVDASGHAGILRRSMGVETTVPTGLKNIALYDYWENADWVEEIGVGGTRVQVMSQGTGWVWFIPLGPTRTSIGFVCPADYFQVRRSRCRGAVSLRRQGGRTHRATARECDLQGRARESQ